MNLLSKMSIKTRTTLSTLLIFITSLWLLVYFATSVLREDIITMIHQQQFATVTVIAANINDELNDRITALEKTSSIITNDNLNNTTNLQQFIDDQLLLQHLFNGGYFITNTEGTAVASFPPEVKRVGVNFIERDHVATALKEGKTSFSKPIVGKILGAPVVSMATPIRDVKGKIAGSLVGVIDLSKSNFLSHITDNPYGKTGGYIIISPKHKVIVAATDKTRIMQPIPATGVNPLMDRYLQGFEGSGSIVDSRGVEVLSSSRQLPVANWVLVGRIPTEEAYKPIRDMQIRMLFAALILTIIAGVFTWLLIKRQLSPVFEALEILSALPNSNNTMVSLPIKKKDEVGQLIAGFNRLIVALSNSERFLKTIIESEPECIKMLDVCGNILMMNRAGLAMLDADSFEQVRGKCVYPSITDRYRDAFIALTKAVFNGLSDKLEFEIIGFKARHVWLETHAVPFRDENGEITALLGITRDITKRKNTEIEKEIALEHIKKLEGILPICMYCKKIRNKDQSWDILEAYISKNSDAQFSHGICPDCLHKMHGDLE